MKARSVGWLDRKLKWVRRHPNEAAAYGLTVLTLVLLLVGGGFGWLWHEAVSARREADGARDEALKALGEAKESRGIAEEERENAKEEGAARVRAERALRRQASEAAKREAQIKQDLIDRFNDLHTFQKAQQFREANDWVRARQELELVPPVRRDWDWVYLQATLMYPPFLTGHTNLVSSMAFSPDGRRLASGSWDHTVLVWDLASGEHGSPLVGHKDRVTTVAFSPDGESLASGSNDGTVLVWDLLTGKPGPPLGGGKEGVASTTARVRWDRVIGSPGG